MKKNTFYITTPIYYVNSKPHVGTLYSTLLADVTARWKKMCGKDVLFLTGTDEHGQKILKRAQETGVKPQAYVDEMVPAYKQVWELYDISYDLFMRTTDPEHKKGVITWIEKLLEKGDIYKAAYQGWYCVPDETFVLEDSVVIDEQTKHSLCPTCGRELQKLEEESYFFRLSAYEHRLLAFYEEHPHFITPKERLHEVIAFVKAGLKDLSISRKGLTWGIPFPGEVDHSVYVWADALNNYITALGYGNENQVHARAFDEWWPASVQVMGKDIVRFHAIYWPAFLMAVGLPLPKKLLVHGYILLGDVKMSKSLQNTVDPHALAQRYGVDQVRYYLMRHMAVNHDSAFSLKGLQEHINAELANSLGNLVQRVISLALKHDVRVVPPSEVLEQRTVLLKEQCAEAFRTFSDEMNHYQYHLALNAVWKFIGQVNSYFHEQQPWILVKENKELFIEIISGACHSLYAIGLMLWPVMPRKMVEMLSYLGCKIDDSREYEDVLRKNVWTMVFNLRVPEQPLFARHEHNDDEAAVEAPPAQRPTEAVPQEQKISYDLVGIEDFAKVHLVVGKIITCEPMTGSTKLYRMNVDMGSYGNRLILAGVAEHFSVDYLRGKHGVFVANLKPRKMMGIESQGMMLCARDAQTGSLTIATVAQDVTPGTRLS